MNTHPACLTHYFAAWNATSADEIRQHLRAAFGKDTRYLDPKRSTVGVEEFAVCLDAFRASAPGASIAWASGVDSHHNLHRYAWELQVPGRKLAGYDVVEVDAEQRIIAVLSFFGPLPGI